MLNNSEVTAIGLEIKQFVNGLPKFEYFSHTFWYSHFKIYNY